VRIAEFQTFEKPPNLRPRVGQLLRGVSFQLANYRK